jgi:hypothetical protein
MNACFPSFFSYSLINDVGEKLFVNYSLEWCKSQDILLKIISSDEDPRDMENLDS